MLVAFFFQFCLSEPKENGCSKTVLPRHFADKGDENFLFQDFGDQSHAFRSIWLGRQYTLGARRGAEQI